LLGCTFLARRRADRTRDPDAFVHLAVWLGLVSLALGMVTDNRLRHVDVLLLFGLTVGGPVGVTAMAHEVTRRPAGSEGTGPAGMTRRAM
jgi:hypothetical protein